MFWRRRKLPTVTFATSCWERDWRHILGDSDYLRTAQIARHCFPFSERLLVVNNVSDRNAVQSAAERKVEEGVLSRLCLSEEMADEVMSFFQLKRSDFLPGEDAALYPGVSPDWIYYNALAPLTAIYAAQSDYLLYLTGDVWLKEKVNWIGKALLAMEKNPTYKVANLLWDGKKGEAKREAYQRTLHFYVAKEGFSDQLFLVRRSDFLQPIYHEIRPDSSHFPRGDVFEKRVFSYMKNRGWERITYRHGSYIHGIF